MSIGRSNPAPFVGDQVNFTVTGANGSPDPTSAQWTFGDATNGVNSLNPSHTWTRPGNYLVIVTATFADGGTADVTSLATWTVSIKTGTPADWACDQGLLTAKSHGDVLVTASYMGFSGVVEVIRF